MIKLFLYLYKDYFFLETKSAIQLSLRQFLFEVNWISFLGEILKKLCASHHASTHISEKSCFLSSECSSAFFPVYGRKKKCVSFASQ